MCSIKVSIIILLLYVVSFEAQNLLVITTGDLSQPRYSSDPQNSKYNSTQNLNLNKLRHDKYNQPNYSITIADDSGSFVFPLGEGKTMTKEDKIESIYVDNDSNLHDTVAESHFINMTNKTSDLMKISDSGNLSDYLNSFNNKFQSNETFQKDANTTFTQVIKISYNDQKKANDFQPQTSELNENNKITLQIEKINNSPQNKSIANSTKNIFPISINFSIKSKQGNSSYVTSLPSNKPELKNIDTTITLSTTTLQESNNNGLDSNQKKEIRDVPINSKRQLLVPIAIELSPSSRPSTDEVNNIYKSQTNNNSMLFSDGNILKSSYNYNAELRQNNLSPGHPDELAKMMFKKLLNVKPKNNSRILVKLTPLNLHSLEFAEKSTYQSNDNKDQENITSGDKTIPAIFSSNYNLSQSKNDNMSSIRNPSTNDGIPEVAASNVNKKKISSVTISLFPNYTIQSTGNSKIEIRSGNFHDNNVANNNKNILSSDQMRNSPLENYGTERKNYSDLTELQLKRVPSKLATNNKVYHHVFHSNDSQVTINNMVNGNSSLLEVVIESNVKEASILQSKQNTLNSSETRLDDSNKNTLLTEANRTVIQQGVKNGLNTGQIDANVKRDVLVKLALNNSDILKVAKIRGKPSGIISINLNQSQKLINLDAEDTFNNYKNGFEDTSLLSSTEKRTVPTGDKSDNYNPSTPFITPSPSIHNSMFLQEVGEIIENDPITIYYPKKTLISKINDKKPEDVIQDYIDSYGTSNLNIVLNHPKGIPEIVLNDNFFTSEDKLFITTSQGDKLIIRKDEDNNENNLQMEDPENKNISENISFERFVESGDIQSTSEDIYIQADVNKDKPVSVLTRRYRNTEKGPLWWVSTDEGFAPEGGIQASTGFIFKIENDEPGQGFKIDDIDIKEIN